MTKTHSLKFSPHRVTHSYRIGNSLLGAGGDLCTVSQVTGPQQVQPPRPMSRMLAAACFTDGGILARSYGGVGPGACST